MNTYKLLLASSLAPILLGACSSAPDVVVTEYDGTPVPGARVRPVALAVNYPEVYTDARGSAIVPEADKPIIWVDVRKEGYRGRYNVDYSQQKPIRIAIKR